MHFIPGLRLRVPEEAEVIGIDDTEMGEFAYDYVGLETELKPGQAGAFNVSEIPAGEPGLELQERNSENHYEKRSLGSP